MLKTLQVSEEIECDVAIIGAGMAGIIAAKEAARNGARVVVLESGGSTQPDDIHPLNRVTQVEEEYHGATLGRTRCLGGTSTMWGGALLPYQESDIGPHACGWHDGWQVPIDQLSEQTAKIESVFGLPGDDYGGSPILAEKEAAFSIRKPKWPSFSKRNIAQTLKLELIESEAIKVFLDATVLELKMDKNRVCGVVAQSTGGPRLTVNTNNVVVAAGAIETTRLLLLFDRQHGGGVIAPGGLLGKGFHDHISAPIASVTPSDRNKLVRAFGFEFQGQCMRNTRFEINRKAMTDFQLPGSFLHVAFTRHNATGFDSLRNILQSVQSRRTPKVRHLIGVVSDLPWFLSAAWWRYIEKRVLPPRSTEFELHLVTEQEPTHENHIELDEFSLDAFGLPRAKIRWKVSESDLKNFIRASKLAEAFWKDSSCSEYGSIELKSEAEITQGVLLEGGIFHPAGTTRIGGDPTTGVVDNRLRVFGVTGLWAVATSVFPSIGASSPSMALMQFAARLGGEFHPKRLAL